MRAASPTLASSSPASALSRPSASAASATGSTSAAACSGIRAITQFDVSGYPCRVAALGAAGLDRRCAAARGRRRAGRARGSEALFTRRALRRHRRRAKPGAMPGCARASRGAGVIIGSGGGGIDVGETAVPGFLHDRRPARHAVRDSRRHLRDGVERGVDLARPARAEPRAVVRLHQLHGRDRLRGRAHSIGRARRDVVGRHRRLCAAGDDLRLLAHARRVDPL